jgi:hypothetical protein
MTYGVQALDVAPRHAGHAVVVAPDRGREALQVGRRGVSCLWWVGG